MKEDFFLQTCFFWPSTKLLHILLGAAPISTRGICWHGSAASDLSAPGCSWAGARADALHPSTSTLQHFHPACSPHIALVPAAPGWVTTATAGPSASTLITPTERANADQPFKWQAEESWQTGLHQITCHAPSCILKQSLIEGTQFESQNVMNTETLSEHNCEMIQVQGKCNSPWTLC